jgi:hypothetical protein
MTFSKYTIIVLDNFIKKFLLFKMTICILLLNIYSSYGSGLGIAVPAFFGTIDYDEYKCDVNNIGIDFILDTNVSKNSLFNYRLNAGIETFTHKYTDTYYDDFYDELRKEKGSHTGIRIVTDHNFGFGIITDPSLRIWLGPNVRVGFVYTNSKPGISLGAGFTAVGANFNIGSILCLTLETGYLYSLDFYLLQHIDTTPDDYFIYGGLNSLYYAKMSVLFRNEEDYMIYDNFNK